MPVLPPRALVGSAEPAAPRVVSDAARLGQLARAKRVAFRRLRFRLPLYMSLAVLLVVLAAEGSLAWQATRFQQTITTGTYVTSLDVGVSDDSGTEAVQHIGDTFKVGTTVVLEITMVGWNGSAEAQLRLDSTLVATQQWLVSDGASAPPAPESHFSAIVQLTGVGRYRWEIDLTSFAGGRVSFADGSIIFQVT